MKRRRYRRPITATTLRTEPKAEAVRVVLHLFVSGMTAKSLAAISDIRQVCERHLTGDYELEVIDIRHDPRRLVEEQVFAAPTLVKHSPSPVRRLVGSLSNHADVVRKLHLPPDQTHLPERTV